MNKADKIMADLKISHEQYQKMGEELSESFKTSHYKDEAFRVSLSGDAVTFPSHCPMKRKEALRLADWLIEMLREDKQ